MPPEAFSMVLILGFILGLEHSLDADHIAAISTLTSRSKGLKKSSLIGISWGLGHTTTLFLVGLLVLFLKITIPKSIVMSLEFLIGVVLVVLGTKVLKDMSIDKKHIHLHKHGSKSHIHAHSHKRFRFHKHEHKSFAIGLAHGLAGSAALMFLILTSISSPWLGLFYVLVFGAGSIIGMFITSTIISIPFSLFRHNSLTKTVQLSAGFISILIGVSILYEVGITRRLLLIL